MRFRRRSEIVDAVKWTPGLKHPFIKKESTLSWSGKPYATVGEAGWEMQVTEDDWLLTHQDGHYSVISDKMFHEQYEFVGFSLKAEAQSSFIPGDRVF